MSHYKFACCNLFAGVPINSLVTVICNDKVLLLAPLPPLLHILMSWSLRVVSCGMSADYCPVIYPNKSVVGVLSRSTLFVLVPARDLSLVDVHTSASVSGKINYIVTDFSTSRLFSNLLCFTTKFKNGVFYFM